MSTDHRNLIEQHMKASCSGDLDGIVACFTEDARYNDMPVHELVGREQIRGHAATVLAALPDFQWTARRMFLEGNQVCTEWTIRATHTGDYPGMPATGRPLEFHGVAVNEITDGLISLHNDYWDLATVLRQMGYLPDN